MVWRRSLSTAAAAAAAPKTWAQRHSQGLYNIAAACLTCVLASELVKMKYAKSAVEEDLATAHAQLAAVRRLDVDPLAAKLGVDAARLKTALADHFSFPIGRADGNAKTPPPPKML